MATMVKLSLAVAFLCMVIGGRGTTEAVVTCNEVVSGLSPCMSYVTSGGMPSPDCCSGVKRLNGVAQTTQDRQAVCNCLESIAKGISYNKKNVANAAALPAMCKVKLPVDISPDVDCNTIK